MNSRTNRSYIILVNSYLFQKMFYHDSQPYGKNIKREHLCIVWQTL